MLKIINLIILAGLISSGAALAWVLLTPLGSSVVGDVYSPSRAFLAGYGTVIGWFSAVFALFIAFVLALLVVIRIAMSRRPLLEKSAYLSFSNAALVIGGFLALKLCSI